MSTAIRKRLHPLSRLAVTVCLLYAGPAPAIDHSTWQRLVSTYVDDDGKVAYRRLASEARGDLERYLAQLAETTPAGLPRNEQMAFWINAYNAAVVAGIVGGYSPESTVGRTRFFRWYKVEIGGEERTLDTIEHGILRKQFGDARIHFALVCAATSCPKLRREAYIAARLDEQLDDQGRRFVNDTRRNQIDVSGKMRLSRLFEWFEEDFIKAAGSVRNFVARYIAAPATAEAVRTGKQRIEYLEYDWTMNGSGD